MSNSDKETSQLIADLNNHCQDKNVIDLDNIYNCDCVEAMKELEDESINAIITDPPYLYLDHKLDIAFNEKEFFTQSYRVLKDDGFLVFFGRGISLARWIMLCDEIGFKFKEEIIWNKIQNTSPFSIVARVHENIIIMSKNAGVLNRVNDLNIIENCNFYYQDYVIIHNDIKRIIRGLKKEKIYLEMQDLVINNKSNYNRIYKAKHVVTTSNDHNAPDRSVSTLKKYSNGKLMSSIINEQREHYKMLHPTQKPIKLLIKLIELVTKKGDIVFDGFIGAGSTAVACIETNRYYLGYEIDQEYFNIAVKRIEEAKNTIDYILFKENNKVDRL